MLFLWASHFKASFTSAAQKTTQIFSSPPILKDGIHSFSIYTKTICSWNFSGVEFFVLRKRFSFSVTSPISSTLPLFLIPFLNITCILLTYSHVQWEKKKVIDDNDLFLVEMLQITLLKHILTFTNAFINIQKWHKIDSLCILHVTQEVVCHKAQKPLPQGCVRFGLFSPHSVGSHHQGQYTPPPNLTKPFPFSHIAQWYTDMQCQQWVPSTSCHHSCDI